MLERVARGFPAHVLRWYLTTLATRPYALADFVVGVRSKGTVGSRSTAPPVAAGPFKILTDPEDSRKGVSSSIRLYGLYDPELTWVVEQLTDATNVVIDVGANIGWYTLLSASRCRRVIAFEPEPRNFELLSNSVALNSFHNAVLRREVVSDREGEIDLYLSETNRGGHSIVWPSPASVRVASTTLDAVIRDFQLSRVDLLKIDAESAEPAIFRGFRKGLEERIARFIILEFSPNVWGNDRALLQRIFELYHVYEFRRPVPMLVHRKSIDELPRSRQVMLVMERRGEEAS